METDSKKLLLLHILFLYKPYMIDLAIKFRFSFALSPNFLFDSSTYFSTSAVVCLNSCWMVKYCIAPCANYVCVILKHD